MDELYAYIKHKLKEMKKEKRDIIEVDYFKMAQIYQAVCFLKQIREIVDWGEQ